MLNHANDHIAGAPPPLSLAVLHARTADDLRPLAAQLGHVLKSCSWVGGLDLLVFQEGAPDPAVQTATESAGGRYFTGGNGYGSSLRKAIERARGDCLVTMDLDGSHNPYIIPELLALRGEADIVIASRYARNGYSNATVARRFLSWGGNLAISILLDMPVRDMTSSFRLYRLPALRQVKLESDDYGALIEALVRAYAQGFRIVETPFHHGATQGGGRRPITGIGRDLCRQFGRLWRLRNSIDCADYDERAFRSRIWFQRSWQRRRYHALAGMARSCPAVLDVGCGSSQIVLGLPQSDICDICLNKLRHHRGRARTPVRASVFNLPFPSNRYDAVIFSQVIEHLPRDPRILTEIVRVAKPGGLVIVGTPDYATWWTTIEKLYKLANPTGYADEHITHYTFKSLKAEAESRGCEYIAHDWVWGAELIMRFRKK
ncbi:MAG: methyltransferase domain-containing protein [bacterium]|nr:methyltransferase domain-containing protein [Candidatus Sumerlaeota bacterium]